MGDVEQGKLEGFGGEWTEVKLGILGEYLKTYTTVLKNQRFTLTYVDAFAGSGRIAIQRERDEREFIAGSAKIVLGVTDKRFDQLKFVERNQSKATKLHELIRDADAQSRTEVIVDDANVYDSRFCRQMGRFERAVVFVDPFALQADWETVKAIGESAKCDAWILFPASAVARISPEKEFPTDSDAENLTRVFGSEAWFEVYEAGSRRTLFGDQSRDTGVEQFARIYARGLRGPFHQVAQYGGALKNSNNSPMFVFLFAAGNAAGAERAIPIADHITRRLCEKTLDLTFSAFALDDQGLPSGS